MSMQHNLWANFPLQHDTPNIVTDHATVYPNGAGDGFNLTNVTFPYDDDAQRNCAYFDGTAGFDIGGGLWTAISTQYSLSVWIKHPGAWPSNDSTLLSDLDNDGVNPDSTESLWVWIEGSDADGNAAGKIYLNHRGPDLFGSGHGRTTVASASTVPTDEWVHIVITWESTDGTDGITRFYINGVQDGSDHTNSEPPWDSSANIRVGQTKNGSLAFTGYMANLMWWNDRTLGQDEIAQLYSEGILGEIDPLNGLAGVKGFDHGKAANNENINAYITYNAGVSNIVVTDSLPDRTELRTLELSTTKEVMHVQYIGQSLMATLLDDDTIQIISVSSGAESASIASTLDVSGISGITKIYKKKNSSDPGLILTTEDGVVRFIDTIANDGSSHSGISTKQFDISSVVGSNVRIVDVETGGDYIMTISVDTQNGNHYVHTFNYDTEAQVALNNMPFSIPWNVRYLDGVWWMSDGVTADFTSDILSWQ